MLLRVLTLFLDRSGGDNFIGTNELTPIHADTNAELHAVAVVVVVYVYRVLGVVSYTRTYYSI